MTLVTVPGNGFGIPLVDSGDGPSMVINRDTINQLYIGDDNSISAKQGTGNISIIDPLSFMCFDGVNTKYGLSANPTEEVIADVVKGATNWAPSPAQIALELSESGFPILTNPTLLDSFASLLIPGLGTTRAHVPITQPTYEGAMTFGATGAGLVPCQIDLAWDINGTVIDHDTFNVGVPNSIGGTQSIAFRGPTKGNGLTVSFVEPSGTTTITNYSLFQSSHQINYHDWHSTGVAGGATFNGDSPVTGFAPRTRLLCSFAGVLFPASTTETLVLPLWTGKFSLKANTGSGTTDLQIFISGQQTAGLVVNVKTDSLGSIQLTDLFMAREQYNINIRNSNVAAQTINIYMTADEY